jgi:hypothetical protein
MTYGMDDENSKRLDGFDVADEARFSYKAPENELIDSLV